MSWAVDTVVDTVKDVADVIGLDEVVEVVKDDVIKPIDSIASGLIDYVKDDPIKALAQAAVIVFAPELAPVLLPIIEGADVAIAGGDLQDVLKATAKAYVLQEIGTAVSTTVGSGVQSAAKAAEISKTGADIAASVLGQASGRAAVAVVTGRDPLEAFKTGGLNAGVAAILGQVPGFKENLSKNTQQAIAAGITATLAGESPKFELVNGLIAATGAVTSIMGALGDNKILTSDAQRSIVADLLTSAAASAFSGGNVSAAIKAEMQQQAANGLRQVVNDTFKTKVDKVGQTNYKLSETEKAIGIVEDNYARIAQTQQFATDRLKNEIAVLDGIYDEYLAAKNRGDAPTANAAAERYRAQRESYESYKNNYYDPGTANRKAMAESYQKEYARLNTQYANDYVELTKNIDDLKTAIKPVYQQVTKSFVETMAPGFDPRAYTKYNDIGADVDPYEHFLEKGQFEKAVTTEAGGQAEIILHRNRVMAQVLAREGVTPENFAAFPKEKLAQLNQAITSQYGNDLGTLKDLTADDVLREDGPARRALQGIGPEYTDGSLRIEINGLPTDYGAWRQPPSGVFSGMEGYRLATKAEFDSGSAYKIVLSNGDRVYVNPDESKNVLYWNPTTGRPERGTPTLPDTQKVSKVDQVTAIARGDTALGATSAKLIDAAKTAINWANSTGNSAIINTTANVMKAAGGFLDSINGVSVLAGTVPKNTALGRFASALEDLGKSGNTAEYQANIAKMDAILGGAKGVGGTLKAIYGAFETAPLTFIAEYIGVEGIQEIAPLLIGGAATFGVKGAALALGQATNIATKLGRTAGLTAAGMTDIVESAGGAASGAYDEAYAAAKKAGQSDFQANLTALNIAQRTAVVAGAVTLASFGLGGAALERTLLNGGVKVSSGFGDALSVLGRGIVQGTKITLKEGVSEGLEEGFTQAYLEGQLYKLDPTRDVAKEITQAAAFGMIAGGPIAGVTYAGSRSGDALSNALMANPIIANTLKDVEYKSKDEQYQALANLGITNNTVRANLLNSVNSGFYQSTAEANQKFAELGFTPSRQDLDTMTGRVQDLPGSQIPVQRPDGGTFMRTDVDAAMSSYVDPKMVDELEVIAAARDEGLVFSPYATSKPGVSDFVGQRDEASTIAQARQFYDARVVSSDEAREALTNAFRAAGVTAPPTDAQINQFVGSAASNANYEQSQITKINDFVNQNTVTADEAKAAFEKAGYKFNNEEVQQFVGQFNQVQQVQRIAAYVAENTVDAAEVRAEFQKLGYPSPTTDEVNRFVGQVKLDAQAKAIGQYVNENTVTFDEAKKMMTDLGYTPKDNAEVNRFIGKVNEAAQRTAIGQYVDPLVTTEDEVREAFRAANFTANADEVKQFAGQLNEANQVKAIQAYVDPRQVTYAEAEAALKAAGYKPSKTEIEQFVGQVNQEAQTRAIAEYANQNMVSVEEAQAAFAKAGYTAKPEEVMQFVGQTNQATQEKAIADYINPRQTTEAEVQAAFDKAGFKASPEEVKQFAGQLEQAAQERAIAGYVNPRQLTPEEAAAHFRSLGYDFKPEELTQFTGQFNEEQQKAKIGEYVNPRQVTEAEARAYFASQNYTPSNEEVQQFVGQVNQAEQERAIGAYVDPRVVSADEVREAYKAAGLQEFSEEDVNRFVGQRPESELAGQVQEYVPTARTNIINAKLNTLSESQKQLAERLTQQGVDLNTAIDQVKAQTQSQYDALSASQKQLADNLARQGVDINAAIDQVKAQTQSQYDALSQSQKQLADQLTQQGTDINAAIEQVKTQTQSQFDSLTTEQKALADALTKQGVDINTAIQAVQSQQTQLQQTVGQAQQQVTQQQIDAITQLEQQGAYDQRFDYNQDQKIDQTDRIALENQFKIQQNLPIEVTDFQFTPATGSQWAPTGIYAELDRLRQEQAAAAAAQAAAQKKAQATQAQQALGVGQANMLFNMLSQAPDIGGQQVSVKTPDPAKIGYVYDFSSIFANPSQEQMFVSPYAKGGVVRSELDDVNEELLKILRG